MKKIYWLLVLLLSGALSSSCSSDSVLDRLPEDAISEADFFQSQGDLELYLNSLYEEFPGWFTDGAAPSLDIGTDIVVQSQEWFGPSAVQRIDGTLNIPASGGGWDFGNIRSVNFFLQNSDRVESGELLEQFIGEGHFFRAYFYFELFKNFGALPIVTEVPETDDTEILFGERQPRTVVANFILDELDLAISMMRFASELGPNRLNKDVALQFKARVALFEGTWEKYHQNTPFAGDTDGEVFLQIAAEAANEVINNGNYAIATGNPETAYYDLSILEDFSGNPEVMLVRTYDFGAFNLGNSLWNQPNAHGMSRGMTQTYLASDGLPISVSPLFMGDATLAELETNRDPRLAQSVMVPGEIDVISAAGVETPFTVPFMTRCPTGLAIQKWRSRQLFANIGNTRTRDIGYIIFRYAEALLIYAEAKAELETITQADVDMTINQLRNRVGMPGLNMNAITPDPDWPDYGTMISDVLQEIRRERVIELYGEGNRLEDLTRWRAHTIFVGTRPRGTTYTADIEALFPNLFTDEDGFLDPYRDFLSGSGFGFNENRDYLLPLPINELTLNPSLEQNPGW